MGQVRKCKGCRTEKKLVCSLYYVSAITNEWQCVPGPDLRCSRCFELGRNDCELQYKGPRHPAPIEAVAELERQTNNMRRFSYPDGPPATIFQAGTTGNAINPSNDLEAFARNHNPPYGSAPPVTAEGPYWGTPRQPVRNDFKYDDASFPNSTAPSQRSPVQQTYGQPDWYGGMQTYPTPVDDSNGIYVNATFYAPQSMQDSDTTQQGLSIRDINMWLEPEQNPQPVQPINAATNTKRRRHDRNPRHN